MDDAIPLSALNHYLYCARRCYLIHAEQSFADNIHTQRGTAEHERADSAFAENKPGMSVERALPVFSTKLGLSGRCDVVEFHNDGRVFPVEYKHGKKRKWLNDDLQLAAQMLCLTEMLGRPVTMGAIYHVQSRRRREVVLTPALTDAVRVSAAAVQHLLRAAQAPLPTAEIQRCGECSLHEVCQPDALRSAAWQQQREQLFEAEEATPT